MGPWLIPLIGAVGSAIGGLFGFKKAQAETITEAMGTFGTAMDSDASYAMASAQAISSVYASGGWLERAWRPAAMWIFLGLIVARFFGYVPAHLDNTEVDKLYYFFEIGLIGYMPLRSIDKWMRGFQIGAILKEFIKKKIL